MTTKNLAPKPDEVMKEPGRRKFLKKVSLTVAAAGVGTAFVSNAGAQTQTAASRPPAAPGANGGKFGAVHGTDVSASFRNIRDNIIGVGSAEGKVMCDRLASVWAAFAKTGDPNNPQVPRWPAYDATTRATMVFDTDTRVENDPRSEIRKFWEQMPPAASPRG